MQKSNFDKLMGDPLVYYIYQVGFPIYGLPGNPSYIVIVNDDWIKPKEDNEEEEQILVDFYKISDWFEMVNKGSLIAWICACLNKKFIKKEYVKLTMSVDEIHLRSEIVMAKYIISSVFEDLKDTPEEIPEDIHDRIFELVVNTLYACQIIQNHKIVNFKEPAQYYNTIQQITDLDTFNTFFNPILASLKKLTDGMWIKHLKDKAYAKINSTTGSSSERKVDVGEGICENSSESCNSEQG